MNERRNQIKFKEEIGEIYKMHFDAICFFLQKLSRSKDLAEDLAQETFIQAMKNYRRSEIKNLRAWLMGISRNLFLMHMRRSALHRKILQEFQKTAPDKTFDFKPEIYNQMLLSKISERLSELKCEYREIFLCKTKQNLSNKEICQKLNLPERTLRTYLENIKRTIKNEFASEIDIFFE